MMHQSSNPKNGKVIAGKTRPVVTSFKRSGFPHALLTFACFGTTNFLLGVVAEHSLQPGRAALVAPVVLWLGTGILGTVFLFGFWRKSRIQTAIPGKGKLVMALVGGISLALGMMSLKLGFVTDPSSKGPITAVTSANSVLVALLVWFFLGEKLGKRQWAGILVTLAGVAVMALSGGGESAWKGLSFGVITLICFGLTNTLLKVLGHRGVPSITAAMIIWLAVGGCGVFGSLALLLSGIGFSSLKPFYLMPLSLAAGMILGIGMWSLKRGVTLGRAGPVVAVAGANAWLVALLDLIFFHHLPIPLKLAGMAIVVAGVALLAFATSKEESPSGDDV